MMREKMREHHQEGGLERSVVKLSDHPDLFHLVLDLGVPGLQPREWLLKALRKKQDDDCLVSAYEDVQHEDFPKGKYVRNNIQRPLRVSHNMVTKAS
mmetsp:Transcript_31534/g.62523  ORF Transcript_31534/g.62523 Transcript_31534/m.62523 type:complete len:97 (-) Transcript_31534:4-294(-)